MPSLKRVVNSFYFRAFVVAGLLFLFSRRVDFYQVIRLIQMVNPLYLVAIFTLITIDRTCMAYKWNILLKARQIDIPLLDVVKTYYVGNFVGSFLPATVGIDITRAVYLKKYKPDLSRIASSIIIERVLGFIVLNVFSLFATFLVVGYLGEYSTRILWFNLLILGALSGTLAISFSFRLPVLIENRFSFLENNAFFVSLRKVYASYQAYRGQRKALVLFILWTFVQQSFPIMADYLVACALGLRVPLLFFVVAIPIFLFLTRIPVAPNILGIQEGLFVLLFSFAHVSATQAFTLGLAQHVLTMVGVSPGLFFYLLSSRKNAAEVSA